MPEPVQHSCLFGTKRGLSFASLRAYSDCYCNRTMWWLLFSSWQEYELWSINPMLPNRQTLLYYILTILSLSSLPNRIAILLGGGVPHGGVGLCLLLLELNWQLVANRKEETRRSVANQKEEMSVTCLMNWSFLISVRISHGSWVLESTLGVSLNYSWK